jgi:hypothetical protein
MCEEDYSTDAETVGTMNDFYEDTVKRSSGVGSDWMAEVKPRKIKVYNRSRRINTEFFSTFPPTALMGAVFTFVEDKKIDLRISSNSFKAIIQTLTDSGNEITFTVQCQKLLREGASRKRVVESEDSSDSEGEYENPKKILRNMDDRDAESSSDSEEEGVPYCLSFKRKKGPLADFLGFYS